MIKLVLQNFISLLILLILLFVPAGTLNWPAAWVFFVECAVSGALLGMWLYRTDPQLFAERSKLPFQKGQKIIDKIIIAIFLVGFIAWYPFMALDAEVYQWSHVPIVLQVVGFFCVLICMYLCYLVFKVNTFAATAVRLQSERHQKVISIGVYAIVRHPMYAALIFYFFGVPLLLGSWWGIIWGFGLIILLGVRAVFEEQTLKAELAGYDTYMQKVRYRFIPYIW